MAQRKSFDIIEEEFAGVDFHSVHLEHRFIRTMETLIRQPDASIWEASETRSEASDFSPQPSTGCWAMKVLTGRRAIRRMREYGGTIMAVVENERILDEIRKQWCQGRVELTLPRDSRSRIPEREAVLQMRYASYSIKRTDILNPVKTLPDYIDMRVIYVKEEQPPKGKKPVEWLRKLRFRGDQ
jgi:hypothetical protein